MKRLSNAVFRWYQRAVNSIGFYPTLIAAAMALLCALTMRLEFAGPVMHAKQAAGLDFVSDPDNARVILGTIVGGIISLTVFSFSMVMVVLNRASATLSPRVIPGLVTRRSHQYTLGVYVGTIVFALLTILEIRNGDSFKDVPQIGVVVSVALTVLCLVLFVYFIHSISEAIQVDVIIQDLFDTTVGCLDARRAKLDDSAPEWRWPADGDWHAIDAVVPGYFRSVNEKLLVPLLRSHDLVATVTVPRGTFVVRGRPLLRTSAPVDDAVARELLSCFVFYTEENPREHFYYGFKQIMEIAVKALSPAINDPGTGIKCMDLLSVLFARHLALPELDVAVDDSGTIRLYYPEASLDWLLYRIVTPIREYGEQDSNVMLSVLEGLKNILYADSSSAQERVIVAHIRSVCESIDHSLKNTLDREVLNEYIDKINSVLSASEPIEPLSE
ncbi:MAG: DUF2254 domain-containing protein [Myxococcales bacterium]|nr:DUF2254 domain-containing protein [Myxococcales bacterium]